ncbi:hypothetical protein [Pseudoalteromonas sp. H105]|uniref:hypothetical protein n=1 Tax=Pseudoalteromonas sp. H105 TaxID=1348393 RepID=UPI0007323E50|nr:hypothetical protein [Pseudoalteromonas sp. H105]KTF16047.1 hypothetical protein ATS75_06485 [Pseudoalteromonas sp. H105]
MKLSAKLSCLLIVVLGANQQAFSYQEERTSAEHVTNKELIPQEDNPLEKKVINIQHKIDTMMQDTASWLDNMIEDDNGNIYPKAAARGYVQLGWIPRTADLSEFDPKFKVHLSLPRWNNKVSLVFDNDDEDEIKLDYEASSISQDNDAEELNITMQYIKSINDSFNIKYKVGISKEQLFLRSEIKKRWVTDDYSVGIMPRLDYFLRDGWAPSIKGTLAVPIDDNVVSFSASWQRFEKEKRSRQKLGLYYVNKSSAKNELVSGLQFAKNEIGKESFLISIRQRNLIYKDWLFLEFEPFLEFEQENDYRRELGLAIRLITYYGPN